jgi:hypothetical protein
LAAEKLAAVHGCTISRETLRGWMIAAGLWVDRRHRLPSPHQPRRRRDCFGDLVQIDGSEHAWFEGRAAGGNGATQFGRALSELNIDIFCANGPQAKGRVERGFGTLQDRLVKELRLASISTVEAANAWLPGFVEDYNKPFGRAPANAKDLHRPLTEVDDPDEVLAWREERTVTRNLTLRYDRMMLLLGPNAGRARARSRGGELPGRAFCRPTRSCRAAVPGVRQDRDGDVRRDRREQAAGCGIGVRARAAGGVSAEP